MINHDIATVREFMFCEVSVWKVFFCYWLKKNWPTLTSSRTELPQNIESSLFILPTEISEKIPPINTSRLKSWFTPFTKGREETMQIFRVWRNKFTLL